MNGKFVSYIRVSTKKQAASGLGLDAQRTAVEQYLNGGRWALLKEFKEQESGKDDKNRPQLQAALTLCKMTGAKLIIAKLDRLSRDVEFLAKLQKSSVRFVCADIPEANELVVGILAVIAQDERRRISARIKAALAEAKKRGTKLGAPPEGVAAIKRHGPRARKLAVASIKAKANAFAQDMAPVIEGLQAEGYQTQAAIAEELNVRGIKTARGMEHWTQAGVGRLLLRIEERSLDNPR